MMPPIFRTNRDLPQEIKNKSTVSKSHGSHVTGCRESAGCRTVEYTEQEQTSFHFEVDTDSSNQGIDYIEISQI